MAKGLNRIKQLLKNRGFEIARESDKAVKSASLSALTVAKRKAPVRFGKLRQGINVKNEYLKAEIFSQMPYSVFVEFGTGLQTDTSGTPPEMLEIAQMYKDGGGNSSGQKPQPFMRPAYKAAKGVLKIKLAQL